MLGCDPGGAFVLGNEGAYIGAYSRARATARQGCSGSLGRQLGFLDGTGIRCRSHLHSCLRMADILIMIEDEPNLRDSSDARQALTVAAFFFEFCFGAAGWHG